MGNVCLKKISKVLFFYPQPSKEHSPSEKKNKKNIQTQNSKNLNKHNLIYHKNLIFSNLCFFEKNEWEENMKSLYVFDSLSSENLSRVEIQKLIKLYLHKIYASI